jgi:hypothetical protein
MSNNEQYTYQIFQLFEDVDKFETIYDFIINASNDGNVKNKTNLDFLKIKLAMDIICSINYLHQKNILLTNFNIKVFYF